MAKHETKLILSGQKLTSIPDSVFDKTDLTYLDLGSSNIVFYPPFSAMEDSNANSISELPVKIEQLINLKTLILNSNKLTTLPNSITKLTSLEVLDLSKNKELDIAKELDKLKEITNLKVLKIVDAELRKDDYQTIEKALPGIKLIVTIPEYFDSLK
ncbi:leucine-rich repeat domain-containing protein [Ferruginibacter profundus]